MLTRVMVTTQDGRTLDVAVAVGAREEDATELHLLGTAVLRGQEWSFGGTTWLREGRDEPEISLTRLDTGEEVLDVVALDILFAVMAELDGQECGIVQVEFERICG